MPVTVPMQRGGAKSLPAELKVGGNNPVRRMRAESPGYVGSRGWGGMNTYHAALMGLGDDTTGIDTSAPGGILDPSTYTNPIDFGNTSIVLPSFDPSQYTLSNPPSGYTGPFTLPAGSATPVAPSGYQWVTAMNGAGQGIAKILAISQGGSTTTLPNGTVIMQGSTPGAIAGAGATGLQVQTGVGGLSLGTLGLLAAGVMLFVVMQGRK